MIFPVDSFGRSAHLEFSRSPLLERNAPPPIADELAATHTRNTIFGFGKWVDRDWSWFPLQRTRFVYDAEFREVVFSVPSVSLNSTAPTPVTSESGGYSAGLAGYFFQSASETSRTPTLLTLAWTYSNGIGGIKNVVVTVALEGTPVDVRVLVDGFWVACAAAPDPEPPPPRTVATVLFEIFQAVNDDLLTIRELSRGLVVPPQSQAFINAAIASSIIQPSVSAISGGGFFPDGPPSAIATIGLAWIRHVRHFASRGEIQMGNLQFSFLATVTALTCERGFTEEFDAIIPPILSSGPLADFPIGTLNGTLIHRVERRMIPPNAGSILLTC